MSVKRAVALCLVWAAVALLSPLLVWVFVQPLDWEGNYYHRL